MGKFKGIVDHCLTGMVLSELTQEMDLVDYSRPSAKPCKRVASFRDTSLKDIPMFVCSFEGVDVNQTGDKSYFIHCFCPWHVLLWNQAGTEVLQGSPGMVQEAFICMGRFPWSGAQYLPACVTNAVCDGNSSPCFGTFVNIYNQAG